MTESVQVTNEDVKTSTSKPNPKALKLSNDNAEQGKPTEKAERPLTKVVVRHLPPTMTLESFLEQVSPLPPVDYMYFVKADSSLGLLSFSRAYLNFVNIKDLIIFTEKFDNYVFIDAKGNEYPAIVEFAPFQRIPKQRTNRRKDPRAGTIENDPYYLDFVETLKAEEAQRKSASKTNKQHFFETTSTTTTAQKVTSTPLLEYLKAKKLDKIRVKEDKINEKKKRELERKKAREERTSGRQGGGDAHPVKPQAALSPLPSLDLAEIQTRTLRQLLGLEPINDQELDDAVRKENILEAPVSSYPPLKVKCSLPMESRFIIGTKNLCEMIESGELRVERPSLPAAATSKMTTLTELEEKLHGLPPRVPQHRKHRYSCQRRHRPSRRPDNDPLPSSEPQCRRLKIRDESHRRAAPPVQPPRFVRAVRSLEGLEIPAPWHIYHPKPYWTVHRPVVSPGHVIVARRPALWPQRLYFDEFPDDRPSWFPIRRKLTPFRGLYRLRQADPRSNAWLSRS